MAGPGERAVPCDRVVDGVQAGGTHHRGPDQVGRRVVRLLLAEAEHQVVEVGQELVGRQIHVRRASAPRYAAGPSWRPH